MTAGNDYRSAYRKLIRASKEWPNIKATLDGQGKQLNGLPLSELAEIGASLGLVSIDRHDDIISAARELDAVPGTHNPENISVLDTSMPDVAGLASEVADQEEEVVVDTSEAATSGGRTVRATVCTLSQDEIEAEALSLAGGTLQERVTNLQDMIRKANTPIYREVEKVVKVDRPVEVKVIVDEDGNPVRAEDTTIGPIVTRQSQTVSWNSLAKTRTTATANTQVSLYDDPRSPTLTPNWVWFNPDRVKLLLWALENQRNVFLTGGAGTGKTETVKNICALTGRRLVRINLDNDISRLDLFGGYSVTKGSTRWEDGVFTDALRTPGTLILLDEVTFGRASNLAALQAVLENDGHLVIPETGEVVKAADGVCIWAADNTNGRGDQTGLFADTRELNHAFLDRFAATIEFAPLDPGTLTRVLVKTTGIPEAAAKPLVHWAKKVEQGVHEENLRVPVGLRRLLALSELLVAGVSTKDALRSSILAWTTADDAEVLEQLITSDLDTKMVEHGLDPNNNPAPDISLADTGAERPDMDDVNWGDLPEQQTGTF